MDAEDEHELARLLRKEGYVLVSARVLERKEQKRPWAIPFLFGRVSLADKLMFTRNLRVMVSAGISLPRGLTMLASQSKSRKFRNALQDIAQRITRGQAFSEALASHPDIFSELFCSMVRIGEESGTLEEVLKNLSLQMEREYELKSKIKGALMYPAVVISAMIGIGILMLVMVVPQLAAFFEELQIELPLTTRIIIAIGAFLTERWYLVPFILLAIILILRFALATKQGKKIKDAYFLRIPLLSSIVKQSNVAYVARTLGSLIASGIPIVNALEVLSRSIGNAYFKDAIIESAEKVRKGERLSEVLSSYSNLFPITIFQMLQVGEETGQTAEILQKLAEFYEEEVTNATKNLSSVIEPILMLIIGGVVAFFAVSMIQPIYSISKAF